MFAEKELVFPAVVAMRMLQDSALYTTEIEPCFKNSSEEKVKLKWA